ncbi:MAG: hypothetical protein ACTHJ5_09460 [Ilyomonas sp.]
MNKVEKNIVRLLTGKDHLEDVSVDELQTITNEHPYFSVAQLLLTKKMKQDNHPGFEHQLQKTALYFPNTGWLHYQLLHEEEEQKPLNGTITLKQQPVLDDDVIILTPADVEENSLAEEGLIRTSDYDDDFDDDDELSVSADNADIEIDEEMPNITIETEEELSSTEDVILSSKEIEQNNLSEEGLEAGIFNQSSEIESPETEEINFQPSSAEEQISSDKEEETSEQSTIIDEALQQPLEIHLTHSPEIEEESKEEPEFPELDEEEIAANASGEPLPVNRLSGMLQEQAAALKKPVEEDAKLPIESEPYHTIDYFESQGIRLENQQQDKLGNKVRKFTDWLKQMKRINPQPADLGTDPEMEHVVQDIAESSNEAKEIVTEAMAEVLKKQGKTDKAIQLYTKLSFLNPDKSAYFAAKIQELKGI